MPSFSSRVLTRCAETESLKVCTVTSFIDSDQKKQTKPDALTPFKDTSNVYTTRCMKLGVLLDQLHF